MINLSTARPPFLVVIIYTSLDWILFIIWKHIAPLQYYWPIIGQGDGGSYLRSQDWQVNTKGSPTKQVRKTPFGGSVDRSMYGSCMSVCPLPTLMSAQLTDNYKVLFLADWHINNPFVGPSEMMVHQNAGNYKMYLTSKLITSYGPIRRLNLCISLTTHTCNVWHKVISHICWTIDHHFKHSVETEIGYGQEIFCTKFEVSWFKLKIRVTFWQVNSCLFYSVLAHVKLTHLTTAHALTLQCFDTQTSCLEMLVVFCVCTYSCFTSVFCTVAEVWFAFRLYSWTKSRNLMASIYNWCKDCFVSPSIRHEKLTLAITLPFLNISLSNYQIILCMMTQTQWCQFLCVKVTFAWVFPLYVILIKHPRVTSTSVKHTLIQLLQVAVWHFFWPPTLLI